MFAMGAVSMQATPALHTGDIFKEKWRVSEMKFEPATHGTSLGDNRFTVMPADPPTPHTHTLEDNIA